MEIRSSNAALAIPALNPTPAFFYLVESLTKHFGDIIIVNDGSDETHSDVFREIKRVFGEKIRLLSHEQNRGKGAALKTAFAYYLESDLKDRYLGVVTMDCDGQHEVSDAVKLDAALGQEHCRCIHIGCRNLNSKVMPFRSKLGNKATALAFSLLYGVKLKDTQTGLRGFSGDILDWLVGLQGDRFEYEMNMLIHSKEAEIALIEHSITTKYEVNHTSHYHTVSDSLRVAKVLAKPLLFFILAAAVAGAVDLGGFSLLYYALLPALGVKDLEVALLFATVLSRVLSSGVNFACNRFLTFGGKNISRSSIFKYYSLWLVQMGASYGLVLLFTSMLGGAVWVKLIVDFCLSLISYQVQMHWVFKKKSCERKDGVQCREENIEERNTMLG
ncbi:MAG: bifunctional glycosyltransferase family 2/GtrA family protein [Clostridia bacterium]|nr:bifunctional glycosyltransferase family 2/GtrA family protein [Clostridia bacterium]